MENDELRKVTLCFPVRQGEVLLAMKKRGFGIGKWNGAGGKVQDGEGIAEATIRETEEEIGLTPTNLRLSAILDFYFPDVEPDKNWDQQMHVYLSDTWDGSPTESEEMLPRWFNLDEIPFTDMWVGDDLWIPRVLAGEKIRATIVFEGKGDKLKEISIDPVNEL